MAAELRDALAARRDGEGGRRDDAARIRDLGCQRRDAAAQHRDVAAERRDADASRQEQDADWGELASHGTAVARSAAARRAAATDRHSAAEDRRSAAGDRAQAELARTTARTDRHSGAAERGRAGADRNASARDRLDASLDGLTGAYLRGPGLLQLEREVLRAHRTGQPLTVAFLDVDGLKAVNDGAGHAAGDRLLAEVAVALRDRLRPYDLVIRYGGDEFVCVLAGIAAVDAQERFTVLDMDLQGRGSVTVGLVTAQPDESPTALVARADAALYAQRTVRARHPPV